MLLYILFQNELGNGLANGFYIGVAGKLEFYLAYPGHIQLQLGVQIKNTGSFQGKSGKDGRIIPL